jgi:hypothetical protein
VHSRPSILRRAITLQHHSPKLAPIIQKGTGKPQQNCCDSTY